MIDRLRGSLGARIVLIAALNLALLTGVGLVASGVRVPLSPRQLLMQMSANRISDVSRQVALDLQRTPREGADELLARYSSTYNARFMVASNDGVRLAGAPIDIPAVVRSGIAGPPPGGRPGPFEGPRPGGRFPAPSGPGRVPPRPTTPPFLMMDTGGEKYWIGVRIPIQFAGSEITPGTLLIASSSLNQPLLFPARVIGWALLALVITLACWWPTLRGITKGLGTIEHATGRIAEGRFDTRIEIGRRDEIGRLSASIERMAARLGALVTGQKRFLGDTAHELRSPLGRMQVALEILDTRIGEAERGYVRDLKEDVEALSLLTDELLQYAKAELTDRSVVPSSVALAPLVDRAIAREAAGFTCHIRVERGMTVSADPQLLERALSNVVRNAVKYAGAAGPIEITAAAENGQVVVSVADSGPGVAPASLERIFEPFFREDDARGRRTGGVGLGLAIVRSAIEASGGSVSCRNREPHGLEVILRLEA